MKRYIIAIISVFFSIQSGFGMPLHPELYKKLDEENRLQNIIELYQQAKKRGVDEPNPAPPRWDLSKRAEQPSIVLLADFDDNQASTSSDHYTDMLFSVGVYPGGSMADYYLENSYGKLSMTGEVLGWFRMPNSYDYYVDGQYGFGSYPKNAQGLVEDAVLAADSLVDFSQFDADGDGFVDCLFVVHAGPGAEQTGNPNDIWSHAWAIPSSIPVDGVSVSSYSMEPEDGKIGVFAHELGHVLGLPDLYDYGYDSQGVGFWSIMAAGSWGGGGAKPVHFDAWCKYKLGFLNPIVLTTYLFDAPLPQVETDTIAYKLWTNGTGTTQYFLIENRQRVGFDGSLRGEGLLVYHVDETVGNNDDQTHYKVAVEQADGEFDLENNRNSGDSGDPYPGTTDNRVFDAFTLPNSRAYDGHDTEVSIWQISDPGSLMIANLAVVAIQQITVESYSIIDSMGNLDGRGDPGETVRVMLCLRNSGQLDAESVFVFLSTDDTTLTIIEDSSFIGFIKADSSVNNSQDPFIISIKSTAQPHLSKLYLDIVAEPYNYSKSDSILLMIGRPNILVVDDDGRSSYEKFYHEALDELGVVYDRSAFLNAPVASELHKYSILIWFTGDDSIHVLTPEEMDSIVAFLENGGNLFITGQNIGANIGSTEFFQNYLHSEFLFGNSEEYGVLGVDSDTIGGGLRFSLVAGDGANNQTSPDVISPNLDADSCFYYRYGIGACGVKYEGNYKLVYLSFGFEGIYEKEYRTELMQRVLSWFGYPVEVKECTPITTHGSKENIRIFPNPFDHSTTVGFTLRWAQELDLEIYDLQGRLVKRVVSRELPKGEHTLSLGLKSLSSGVYFLVISNERLTLRGKIVKIR